MHKISEVNKSYLFFLIFTIISSTFAYNIIVKAYDNAFAFSTVEIETTNASSTSDIPSTSILTAKLNEAVMFSGATGTVTEVVEDSRCAMGVQCIQAGTVRVKAHFSYGPFSKDVVLVLNQPFSIGGHFVTLTEVEPAKTSGITILAADYVFTLSVK